MLLDLDYYINKISNLTTKVENGKKKPNKAIMLLSVIDLIRCGYFVENKIYIDSVIELSFKRQWSLYFQNGQPVCWTPFWHLKQDGFWHFEMINSVTKIETLAAPGQTASVGKMKSNIKYVYLDDGLFTLLIDKSNRNIFVRLLIEKYIAPLR